MNERTKEKQKKLGAPFGNKRAVGNDGGRPEANIDWRYVDNLLEAGCTGAGIAPLLGINENTLYDRCYKDRRMRFSELSRQMNAKGDDLIRKTQYDKALGGDNTLLIWLGKCRLKQTDAKMTINLEGDHPIAQLINEAAGRSKNLVRDEDDSEPA